ncbi:hypothetical protein KY290_001473 [Solanum tuberosum]|uniref:Uncharacterized protein n=1 Tax=Solanum tuberosum TaxID=4113 RepID=A0ABQ7WPJ5_SOLTU|nr:hypothetical protein KY289_001646 [Solanum tuberosum]KAH0781875.1 hypothetical protein KY290_001473 [Solanum tuberosum]
MVQGFPEIHTKNKVENTYIISLDVSNQEEDEEEEDVPRYDISILYLILSMYLRKALHHVFLLEKLQIMKIQVTKSFVPKP